MVPGPHRDLSEGYALVKILLVWKPSVQLGHLEEVPCINYLQVNDNVKVDMTLKQKLEEM